MDILTIRYNFEFFLKNNNDLMTDYKEVRKFYRIKAIVFGSSYIFYGLEKVNDNS